MTDDRTVTESISNACTWTLTWGREETMRNAKMLLLAGMLLWLAGCSPPSLEPLFTQQDLVFEPRLTGTWADKDEKDTWAVKRSGEKSYDALCTEDGEPHWFKLHLVQLGAYLFLDLTPKEQLALKNGFFASHWVPTHTFFRVRIDGDRLRSRPWKKTT